MQLRSSYTGILLKALLILGWVAVIPSRADSIYNNLGPGDTWIINREWDTNFDFMATPFVTTAAGNLGGILTPLFNLNNPVSLGLYTDSGGKPDSLLEDWNVTAPGFPGVLTTIPSVQNPFLSANTEYWLVISLTSAQKNNLAWYQNNQGVTGGIWAGTALGSLIELEPDSPSPAIQLNSITSSAVPEPESRIVIAACLALVVIARLKRCHLWFESSGNHP